MGRWVVGGSSDEVRLVRRLAGTQAVVRDEKFKNFLPWYCSPVTVEWVLVTGSGNLGGK